MHLIWKSHTSEKIDLSPSVDICLCWFFNNTSEHHEARYPFDDFSFTSHDGGHHLM
jgi:hypothetical protein